MQCYLNYRHDHREREKGDRKKTQHNFLLVIITTNVLINIKAWLHTRNGFCHLDKKIWKLRKADNISLKLIKANLLISWMGYSLHFYNLEFEYISGKSGNRKNGRGKWKDRLTLLTAMMRMSILGIWLANFRSRPFHSVTEASSNTEKDNR